MSKERPNIAIIGEISIANEYDPLNPEDAPASTIETLSMAAVVTFPDVASLKAAINTGIIPKCDVLGGETS